MSDSTLRLSDEELLRYRAMAAAAARVAVPSRLVVPDFVVPHFVAAGLRP